MAFRASLRRLNKLQPSQRLPWAEPGTPIYRAGKETTGITGLRLLAKPLPVLLKLYANTLKALEDVPPTAVYRSATEAITRHRIEVVQRAAGEMGEDGGEEAVEAVEQELGLGQIEEVIDMAEDEERLVRRMLEWKPWQDLIEKPLPKQWEYFKVAPSTTHPDS